MAGAGGLAVILLFMLLGLGLVVGAFGMLVYGIVARDPRRGLQWSRVAVAVAGVAILFCLPVWRVVLSGRDTHGDPLNYDDASPMVGIVVVEAVTFLAAAAGVIRQWRRRRAADRAS